MPAGEQRHLDAVHALYSDHHRWLCDWLRRKLGCAHSAADLAQDTFLRVMARQHAGEVREPRAFLATIARGLMVNHWRRLDLERTYLDGLRLRGESFASSPEDRALIVEALVAVDAMLDTLPERQRRAFLMSQLDGMGYRDIAAELKVSERMVKKYMAGTMLHCLAAVGGAG